MKKILFTTIGLCHLFIPFAQAQLFTKVSDANNPIVTSPLQTFYEGASWVDYDNDGRLDLFIAKSGLYHNDGNGAFTKMLNTGLNTSTGIGNTWSDYDNDGFIDCFISGGGSRGSSLFHNDGNGTFSRVTVGDVADSTRLRGWGSAFGDYDNDGFIDIVIAAPLGFAGITDSNKVLHNNGNGTFTRVDTSLIAQHAGAYTVPSWYDYDLDGDVDLFIGCGPVNGTVVPDSLYENNLFPGGSAYFTSSIPSPLSTDPRDGQLWNWIDFDNDGDLDGFVTSYTGTSTTGYPNHFYRNDNGTYIKLTVADVGPIVGDADISLANIWEDFDNDGDMDCIVINDGGQNNIYYQNNWEAGSSLFTKIITEPFCNSPASSFSVTAGDYDSDGDLDLYVASAAAAAKGLYRNDVANGNKWINLKLTGVASNHSALGTVVSVKSIINGNPVWQMREISAQNSFDCMNSLNVEFGLSNATMVDSLIIKWPSGQVDYCVNIPVNNFYNATEGQCPVVLGINGNQPSKDFFLISTYPNPFNHRTVVSYYLAEETKITLDVFDVTGNLVLQVADEMQAAGVHNTLVNGENLKQGLYYFRLSGNNVMAAGKMIRVD